jgi:hypothetical protein
MSHSVEVKSVAIISRKALFAAANDLKKQGINCDLVQKAAPRMWFKDQLQRQLGKSSEICDFVLQLHDCPYDVGFIKQGKNWVPVFDDMTMAPPERNKETYKFNSIAEVIGVDPGSVPFEPETEIGRGKNMQDPWKAHVAACRLSKLLMSYSKHATIHKAQDAGYIIESAKVTPAGEVLLTIQT